MTSPSQLILLYLLPAVLTAAVLFFVTWKSPAHPIRWELLLAGALFGGSLYFLESVWPWNTWPITRSLHWLPFGAIALAALTTVSALFSRFPLALRLLIPSVALAVACFVIVRPYYLQLNPEGSPEFHRQVLALILSLLVLHACGAALLARRFPAIAILIVLGIIHLGAIGFAAEATASGKMAQLIGVSGVIIAGTFAVHLLRPQKLLPEFAFLVASMSGMSVIFSFYVTSSPPHLASISLWLLTPVVGFLWCIIHADSELKNKLPLTLVAIWVVCMLGASGFAVTQYHPRNQGDENEGGDDYHDLYGVLEYRPFLDVNTKLLPLSDSAPSKA